METHRQAAHLDNSEPEERIARTVDSGPTVANTPAAAGAVGSVWTAADT